jgi:voltage-gated potassium channel
MPQVVRPARDAALGPFLWRLGVLVAMITALLGVGTVGFVLAEDVSLWRGFIWTLDTIATVGSVPQPDTVAGQALKVVLITLGVGTLFYALVTVTEFFVAGHLSGLLDTRRTLKMIDSLSGHHLICGFGRVGRQIAGDLSAAGESVVVIDHNPSNREPASALGVPFVEGEPAEDETLRQAGIERAESVIACVDSDAENIFVTLTARELRPEVTIVARASADDSEKKLRRAGADRVISPYKTSGTEMARLALHPQVPVAVDVSPEYRLEEIETPEGCDAIGVPLGVVKGAATIVALHRAGGEIEFEPPPYATAGAGDVVAAVGSDPAMDALEAKFAPPAARD